MNKKQKPIAPKSKQDRVNSRRGVLLLLSAYFSALIFMIVGIKAFRNSAEAYRTCFICILSICCGIPALLFPLNIWLRKRYMQKIENKNVEESIRHLVSHRDFAEKTSAEKLALVKRIRLFTGLYAVAFAFFGAGTALSAGALYSSVFSTFFTFVSAFLFLSAFSRIRFSAPKAIFKDSKIYVSEKDFPQLYATARQAADALHCSGDIKIALVSGCNAGINIIGSTYSVMLGAILLNISSRDEIYNILLHEFAHVAGTKARLAMKDLKYNNWILNGGNPHFLSGLTSLLFCFSDTVCSWQYSMYRYASSVIDETEADMAMCLHGNAKTAASALIKMKYYELFKWEKKTYDTGCPMEPEKPEKTYLTKEILSFKKAISLRAEKWNSLIDVEILALTASHPTLKMRLEALGVTELTLCENESDDEYMEECGKALSDQEEKLYEIGKEIYEEDRKNEYTIPKQRVEAWEAAGKPIIAEEYADIGIALRRLGRVTEANELYDRAIAELPDPANLVAYYMKGAYLLHCYDEAGLEYMYHAIENDSNLIDEGLWTIGCFCCITGRQEDLEVYREKAVKLKQNDKDKYSHLGVLNKKDNLSSEHLPDGMLDEILEFIRKADENKAIERIYLVRKTITDDFFTSVFVVKYSDGTDNDVQNEIHHKIFRYLDTSSKWQFSLFDYSDVSNCKIESIENSCVYSKALI